MKVFVTARRRVTALFLTCALALSLAAPALARETDFFDSFPADIPSLDYGAPETESAEYTRLFEELSSLPQPQTEAEQRRALELMDALAMQVLHLSTCQALCLVDYHREPARYEALNDQWAALVTQASSETTQLFQTLLSGPLGALYAKENGQEELDALLAASTLDAAQQALVMEDQALQNEYWKRYNSTTYSYQGATWDYAKLEAAYAAGMELETYWAIAFGLMEARGNAMAEVLEDMIPLRNRLAKSLGYDDYAQYAYAEDYGRDYTPEDAKVFHQAVKSELVPLMRSLNLLYYMCADPNLQSIQSDLPLDTTDGDAVLDAIQPYMTEISSEYAQLFSYMRKNKLVDIDGSAEKLAGAFTVGLPDFGAAYLFAAPSGTYGDLSPAAIHEFGHFAAFSLVEEQTGCYDILEIHSQGLESLYLPYADELVGEALADPYRFMVVYQFVSAVVQGALFDEFQTTLYQDGSPTPAEMHALFAKLAKEYGCADTTFPIHADGSCYSWVDIHHTFTQPFYYISYATSAVPALELVVQSENNYTDAADRYLKLVSIGDSMSYADTLTAAGLSNPFQPGALTALSDGLYDWLNGMIPATPFRDLQNHWSKRFVDTMSRLNVFQDFITGDNIQPDRAATRGEAVSMLWRMISGQPAAAAAEFTDISETTYCAAAANWCAGYGIIAGYDTGAFGVDDPVLREQAALILYQTAALMGLDTSLRADLSSFPDGGRTDSWAKDAMRWAVAYGLFGGRADGTLDPRGQITRAELSTVLSNLMG